MNSHHVFSVTNKGDTSLCKLETSKVVEHQIISVEVQAGIIALLTYDTILLKIHEMFKTAPEREGGRGRSSTVCREKLFRRRRRHCALLRLLVLTVILLVYLERMQWCDC